MVRDAPRFELEIRPDVFLSGALLSRVIDFELEATVDGADQLRLVVLPWDEDRRRWLFAPGEALGPGSEVVAWVGYGRDLQPLQAFRIEHRRAPMRAGETPRLEVIGYSAEARLVANEKSARWTGPIADSQIARDIADAHGLAWTPDTIRDTKPRQDGRTKAKGTTDWDFLRHLAYANGFGEPWTRWDPKKRRSVLYWRQTSLADQDEQVTFRLLPEDAKASTCLSWDASYSTSSVPTSVEVLGWDSVKGEPVRVKVTIDAGGQVSLAYLGARGAKVDPKIRSGTQLKVATLKGGEESTEVLTVEGGVLRQADEIGEWARRYLTTRNQGFTTAEAETRGYEKAWIGQVHRWEGVPPEFEGPYEATTVTHRFKSGVYRCAWSLRRLLEELPIREAG